ncbi:DUF5667 domain-containing protein [Desulfitobacterium metallireducens]|uniref:DUF5667 domain-containing protein n=1 Tax=Desulfitobacterium metallireducens DSM 15288 TaxID=871968 RepID=W0EB86_9FIRM|nr:DUF5667 domain-containing protein [Desulfitobacterium metallireducens]AHF08027.1 hypothetical protein DESME_14040 [Desulfitobacterium metallireducens DSM 15288]
MKKIKALAFALSLSLCTLPLSAPLALAVDGTATTGTTGTTATTDTTSTTGATDTTSSTGLDPVVDANGDIVDPGTLPDSPFYWLTELIAKLQVILTTDPAAKAQLLEKQSLEKMAEAEIMIESGDTEKAQTAMEGYTQKLTEAQAFLNDLTATDSETAQKLELALSQSHAQNIQTLGGLLDKLPPQASEKVALNIVRSMEKSIAKMEKKDQIELARELRKATKNVETSELTQEEQDSLDELQNSLESDAVNSAEPVTVATDTSVATMSVTDNSKANANGQLKQAEPKEKTELVEQEKLEEQNDGVEVENKQLEQNQKEVEQKQPEQKQVAPKENNGQGRENAASKGKNQNSGKAQESEDNER